MISADELVVRLALDKGWVGASALAAARAAAAPTPGAAPSVLTVLVATGHLQSSQVARLLSEEFALPVAEFRRDIAAAVEARRRVPRELAVRLGMLPLAWEHEVLHLAVSDPLAVATYDWLGQQLGTVVALAVAAREDIAQALETWYADAPPAASSRTAPPAEEAEVVTFVQALLVQAIERSASDIHLESQAGRLRVRLRIDGVLRDRESPPPALRSAVLTRLKILAGLSIAEKRRPQDGRLRFTHEDRSLDLRVSSLPGLHGENLVLRLLDPGQLRSDLRALGLLPADHATLGRLLRCPHGLLLITGPTGSGKTTTLYNCLHHLNTPDRKIITVEDPVEYRLPGINQVSVSADTGLSFAVALRAILRQSPNVILIGEIRDRETAQTAVNAALTGHLVFSTLHTGDAAGAVARLVELGVPPFLLAAALRAVLAQRLVPRLCRFCQPAVPPAPAAPCGHCQGRGYQGRLGLFEVMPIAGDLPRLIHSRAATLTLRAAARRQGVPTLREDGLRKAAAGLTTTAAVLAATADSEESPWP